MGRCEKEKIKQSYARIKNKEWIVILLQSRTDVFIDTKTIHTGAPP